MIARAAVGCKRWLAGREWVKATFESQLRGDTLQRSNEARSVLRGDHETAERARDLKSIERQRGSREDGRGRACPFELRRLRPAIQRTGLHPQTSFGHGVDGAHVQPAHERQGDAKGQHAHGIETLCLADNERHAYE